MLWRYERMASSMGYQVVAGVDEVGMGPLAGPGVPGAGMRPGRLVHKAAGDKGGVECARLYPGYGFADHKGYATPAHRAAIRRMGPSPIHRTTWAPFRESALLG